MKKQDLRYLGSPKNRTQLIPVSSGFTLVEILVAMALVTLFMGGLMAMFAGFSKSYTTENVKAEVQQVVRGGVEHMVPYIRMVGFDPMAVAEPPAPAKDYYFPDTPPGIRFASGDTLSFTADRDMNGYIDEYDNTIPGVINNQERMAFIYEDGTVIRRLYDNNATDQPIVSNIISFKFSYLDDDNQLLEGSATPDLIDDPGLIRTVIIKMTVREPAGRDGFITRTYETRVRCRNL